MASIKVWDNAGRESAVTIPDAPSGHPSDTEFLNYSLAVSRELPVSYDVDSVGMVVWGQIFEKRRAEREGATNA